MMDTVITWMFWIGAGVIAYSAVAASIRYVHFWRRGARTMASEAGIQTVLSVFGLLGLWLIYRFYLPA
jgi:hypothetical protein